jgi:hypothetical protein
MVNCSSFLVHPASFSVGLGFTWNSNQVFVSSLYYALQPKPHCALSSVSLYALSRRRLNARSSGIRGHFGIRQKSNCSFTSYRILSFWARI